MLKQTTKSGAAARPRTASSGRADRPRTLAAEQPSPRRVGRVAAGGSEGDETARLKARLADLESQNAHLADRLAWAIDRIGSVIDVMKARSHK